MCLVGAPKTRNRLPASTHVGLQIQCGVQFFVLDSSTDYNQFNCHVFGRGTQNKKQIASHYACWPANKMWRTLHYPGFETRFGPSTQGAGIRYQNTTQIQILLASISKRKGTRCCSLGLACQAARVSISPMRPPYYPFYWRARQHGSVCPMRPPYYPFYWHARQHGSVLAPCGPHTTLYYRGNGHTRGIICNFSVGSCNTSLSWIRARIIINLTAMCLVGAPKTRNRLVARKLMLQIQRMWQAMHRLKLSI